MKHSRDFQCPNCGADVPARAKACPECGADERTGWSDETIYDGTGIEDPNEFDYEDWRRRETGPGRLAPSIGWFWWVVGVLVLAGIVWLFLGR
jgi:RNA polymerase subunit RPABC4/transcription elongation factor Spt4